MVNVKITKPNLIEEIEVSGHAGYHEYGKDIICASVSTALILSYNLLEKFNQKVISKIDDGYFLIKVINHSREIDMILENLEYMFLDFQEQYPKYIKIIGGAYHD